MEKPNPPPADTQLLMAKSICGIIERLVGAAERLDRLETTLASIGGRLDRIGEAVKTLYDAETATPPPLYRIETQLGEVVSRLSGLADTVARGHQATESGLARIEPQLGGIACRLSGLEESVNGMEQQAVAGPNPKMLAVEEAQRLYLIAVDLVDSLGPEDDDYADAVQKRGAARRRMFQAVEALAATPAGRCPDCPDAGPSQCSTPDLPSIASQSAHRGGDRLSPAMKQEIEIAVAKCQRCGADRHPVCSYCRNEARAILTRADEAWAKAERGERLTDDDHRVFLMKHLLKEKGGFKFCPGKGSPCGYPILMERDFCLTYETGCPKPGPADMAVPAPVAPEAPIPTRSREEAEAALDAAESALRRAERDWSENPVGETERAMGAAQTAVIEARNLLYAYGDRPPDNGEWMRHDGEKWTPAPETETAG